MRFLQKNRNMWYSRISIILIFATIILGIGCEKEKETTPPTISLETGNGFTQENEMVSIGSTIRFKIIANSPDEAITNIVIKYRVNEKEEVKLDSGLYANNLNFARTFWQDTKENAVWTIQVMSKDRKTASTNLSVTGDPNSTYGGINEYTNLKIGMQNCTTEGLWFNAKTGHTYPSDSGVLNQENVDFLCYFYHSLDNNINRPSPTLSSPGEDPNGAALLYDEFYPELLNWQTRNHTAWDIRADNGISMLKYTECHDDSLLLNSFDETWGKKKYKWLEAGLFIPFKTTQGKFGIVEIVTADTIANGVVTFNMKIQK